MYMASQMKMTWQYVNGPTTSGDSLVLDTRRTVRMHACTCTFNFVFGAIQCDMSRCRACLGISGTKGSEGHWGGEISIISQNFPKSP
jgi:hypothetical protein